MPPDERPENKAFHWRREDAYIEVTAEAFAKLVAENGLPTLGPFGGYYYAMKHTTEGEELYRTVNGKNIWWLQQGRYVVTQDNVGGGALTIRISVSTGQVAKLTAMYVKGSASAGSGLVVYTVDEDTASVLSLATVAAGANRSVSLPTSGTASSTTGNMATSEGLLLGPGQYLVSNASAALQTEVLTVYFALLTSNSTAVVIDTTGSAGTPNLGANSISAANALQAVVM